MWRTLSLDKIISYPVGAGGELGAGRDEITTGLSTPNSVRPRVFRRSGVCGGHDVIRTNRPRIKSSPIRWGRTEDWARGATR